MATMDVFRQDPFSLVELSTFVQQMSFRPTLVASLGLYETRSLRTRTAVFEEYKGTLSLIPFTEIGGAASQNAAIKGAARTFQTHGIRKQDTIWASEVAGIRARGTESEFRSVQDELALRFKKLRDEVALTQEYHLLNGLAGIVKDAVSGTTVYDYATEFGISRPASINLDLLNASPKKGALRQLLADVRISVEADLGDLGGIMPDFEVICAPDLFTALTNHPEVRDAYLATANAQLLLAKLPEAFSFEGFTFRRYRAGSGVGVAAGTALVAPSGVPGLFTINYSPINSLEFVNTPGEPVYARIIQDLDRQEWVKPEVESRFLPVCSRPQALRVFTKTA